MWGVCMLTVEQLKAELSALSDRDRAEILKALNDIEDKQQDSNNKKIVLPEELRAILQQCTSNRSEVLCCPHCGSVAIVRNGRRSGRQRYLCKDCHKTFGDTFGTFFYHCRLSVERLREFIGMTLHNYSLNDIVAEMTEKGLHINRATAWYNRHKLCEAILQTECDQDNFTAVAEADEFYTPLSFIGERDPNFFIERLGRMPNHNRNRKARYEYAEKAGYSRAYIEEVQGFYGQQSAMKIAIELNSLTDKAKVNKILQGLDTKQLRKRGISNQQVCILSCIDLLDNLYLSPTCVGRLVPRHLEQALKTKFGEDSILVTDSHRAYKTFANKNKIHLRQIPPDKHTSGPYNLAKLNSCHSRLAGFLAKYKEVSSKYIDHYVALFRWQEKHKRDLVRDKVEGLVDVQTRGIDRRDVGWFKFGERPLPFDIKGIL